MTTPCHPQLLTSPAGSLWLLTCTVDEGGDTVTFTDVLARRCPDEISDPGTVLFELLPLGERILVDVDQIERATPATLTLSSPPAATVRTLRIVQP